MFICNYGATIGYMFYNVEPSKKIIPWGNLKFQWVFHSLKVIKIIREDRKRIHASGFSGRYVYAIIVLRKGINIPDGAF